MQGVGTADLDGHPAIVIVGAVNLGNAMGSRSMKAESIVVIGMCHGIDSAAAFDSNPGGKIVRFGPNDSEDGPAVMVEVANAMEDLACEPHVSIDCFKETAGQAAAASSLLKSIVPDEETYKKYTINDNRGCPEWNANCVLALKNSTTVECVLKIGYSVEVVRLLDADTRETIGQYHITASDKGTTKVIEFDITNSTACSEFAIAQLSGGREVRYQSFDRSELVRDESLALITRSVVADPGNLTLFAKDNARERIDNGAHVLLFYNSAGFTSNDMAPIIGQAGALGRVRICSLSMPYGVDANSVRSEYSRLVSDNFFSNLYGYGPYPVSPGPLLIVVGPHRESGTTGDHLAVRSFSYESVKYSGLYTVLNSDLLLTDIGGDSTPDGPVTRLVATTAAGIQRYVDLAMQYSLSPAERFGETVFLIDDTYLSFTDYGLRNVGDELESSFRTLGCIPLANYTSQLGNTTQERLQAFRDIVDRGVYEVWSTGYSNSELAWSGTLATGLIYDEVVFNTDQSVPVYNVSCNGVSPYNLWSNVYRSLTDENAVGLKAAVCIGSMGAARRPVHVDMLQRIKEKRIAASDGELYADILFESVVDAIAEHPDRRDYYNAFFALGALTEVRNPEIVHVDDRDHQGGNAAEVFVSGNRLFFFYGPNYSRSVEVDIFDIRGYRIASIDADFVGTNRRAIWDLKDMQGRLVSSGVYLVKARDASRSIKATVIR